MKLMDIASYMKIDFSQELLLFSASKVDFPFKPYSNKHFMTH